MSHNLRSASTRRDFLQKSSVTAGSAAAAYWLGRPKQALTQPHVESEEHGMITDDPRVKEFIQKAVDAAVAAGASYADARLTYTRNRTLIVTVQDSEEISVGVRAFANGYWGFASGPVWTIDEAARLGAAAAAEVEISTKAKDRPITLPPIAPVQNGNWVMPVDIDPFQIHPYQMRDIIGGVRIFAGRFDGAELVGPSFFTRQDKAFGASNGSYWTQRTYLTHFAWETIVKKNGAEVRSSLDMLSYAGAGFELLDEAKVRAEIEREYEELLFDVSLPMIPVDVGRYEIVFDASSVANLLTETIGTATQLDRALGFEANAQGTSFLNDPVSMLGTYKVGSPLLAVTADRSMSNGAATVQWDDEGVAPSTVPLVTDGILTGYQSTCDDAALLMSEQGSTPNQRSILPSTGGAFAPTAVEIPLVHSGNMDMRPSSDSATFKSLQKSVKRGLVFKQMGANMDFQQINGLGMGSCFEVRNGNRVSRIMNAGLLFRTPELWNGIKAIGGMESVRTKGLRVSKGEPVQLSAHAVSAVPIHTDELTIIDVTRKA